MKNLTALPKKIKYIDMTRVSSLHFGDGDCLLDIMLRYDAIQRNSIDQDTYNRLLDASKKRQAAADDLRAKLIDNIFVSLDLAIAVSCFKIDELGDEDLRTENIINNFNLCEVDHQIIKIYNNPKFDNLTLTIEYDDYKALDNISFGEEMQKELMKNIRCKPLFYNNKHKKLYLEALQNLIQKNEKQLCNMQSNWHFAFLKVINKRKILKNKILKQIKFIKPH